MENRPFELVSKFVPTGDQPQAISSTLARIAAGKQWTVIQGATGTGKTFTDANILASLNRPTIVMVHNKTLAGQLYAELKELFPNNRVEYFISNFDFYQPEAYLPKRDTYIDKNAVMNEEIDMMRTAAMNSILTRRDTIVVCSVAAIYGLSDPAEYKGLIFEIRQGETLDRKALFAQLLEAQYSRNNLELKPGTFRVHGDVIDIAPATHDYYIRLDCFGDEVESIKQIDCVTGEVQRTYATYPIFPAYDHASTRKRIEAACVTIRQELEERLAYFRSQGKLLEAERLEMRTRQDMESMLEFGRCPGIENYSRHIDQRKPGERPFCLLDYMPKDSPFPKSAGCITAIEAGNKRLSIMDSACRAPSTTVPSILRNGKPFCPMPSSALPRPPGITSWRKPITKSWSKSFARPAFLTPSSRCVRPRDKSRISSPKSGSESRKTRGPWW